MFTMGREFEAKGALLCSFLLLSLHVCCSSGTSKGFSYDAVQGSSMSSSAEEILSFLEKKKLKWGEEVIFPKSHRKLVDGKITATAIHDTVAPITIPSTNPSPDIVTVPSTNPTTTTPIYTNPTTNPVTFPTTAPITVPATNPVVNPPVTNPTTAPVTVPPVTNPVYTPTNPANQPVTNPITTYPTPPVSTTTPTTPGMVPVSPTTGMGQSWCVARSDAPEDALQRALDYACGIGGADCSAIQMSGSCYNPNSLQAHASFAFNSYYQKNPVATSCDFGGTAMVVTVDPSTGTCTYSSSSSPSSLTPVSNPASNPAPTVSNPASNPAPSSNTGTGSNGIGVGPIGTAPTFGTSSGSGSSIINTNSSGGSSSIFGSDSPSGTISRSSFCQPGGWMLLSVVFAASMLHL